MEECLAHGGNDFDIHGHVENDNALIDSKPVMKQNMWQPKQEILTPILEGTFVWDPRGFQIR